MNFRDQLFHIDIFAMRVNLIVILFHKCFNIEVNLNFLLLYFGVNDVDELLLEQKLSIHVKTHLFSNLILKMALEGTLKLLVTHIFNIIK
jgi:hypothetical protein